MDLFTSWIEERELLIPDWMHNIFNSLEIEHPTKTKAASVDRGALPKADILLLFRNTQVRTLKLLADFDAGLWESRTPPHAPESLPTYGSILAEPRRPHLLASGRALRGLAALSRYTLVEHARALLLLQTVQGDASIGFFPLQNLITVGRLC